MSGRGKLFQDLSENKPSSSTTTRGSPFDTQQPNTSSSFGSGRGKLFQSATKSPDESFAPQSITKHENSSHPFQSSFSSYIFRSKDDDDNNDEVAGDDKSYRKSVDYTKRNPSQEPAENPFVLNLKKINIDTNYIKIFRDKEYDIFQYHVELNPPLQSSKLVAKTVENEEIRSKIGYQGFVIGSTLFLPYRIDSFEETICHPVDKSKIMQIKIKLIKRLPLNEQVFVFNILFKQVMKDLNYVHMKNKYFDSDRSFRIDEYMLEIWPGYVLEIVEVEAGALMLQCDVSHRILQKTNVLTQLEMLMPNRNYQDMARKSLVGQSVLTSYNNRTYRVDDIDFETTPLSLFTRGQTEISYVDYFFQQWGIRICNMKQPMLIHRKFQHSTQTTNLIYLVPELCNLTGITSIKDKNITRKLVSVIEHGPSLRYQKLMKFIQLVNCSESAQKRLKSWGIQLDSVPFNIEALVYNEEDIINSSPSKKQNPYGRERNFPRKNFKQINNWGPVLKDSLLEPVNLVNWFIVVTRKDKALLDSFIRCCRQLAPTMTIEYKLPRVVMIDTPNVDEYILAIKHNYQPDDQMVVVVTPESYEVKSRYDAIKKLCCVQLGIASQFIRGATISRSKFQSICPNIIVQITCKLGGVPWGVQIPLNNVMYVGIDIYHKKDLRKISVLAFVASLNTAATKWYSKSFNQAGITDIADSESLYEAMCESLCKYRAVNRTLPKYILIYRDDVGVPVERLCAHEYDPMMAAIREVYNIQQTDTSHKSPNAPHVSFMTTAKRISNKMFQIGSDSRANSEQVENVSNGTVLEMNTSQFDRFYLVSQKMGKTTASPIRISVLKNTTTRISTRHLQAISYKLCFLYYNFTSTCRQPAPGMYAHKLAYFIGEHLETSPSNELEDNLYYL